MITVTSQTRESVRAAWAVNPNPKPADQDSQIPFGQPCQCPLCQGAFGGNDRIGHYQLAVHSDSTAMIITYRNPSASRT